MVLTQYLAHIQHLVVNMPIMSAPNAGAVANKKRITGATLLGDISYDFTDDYIFDNNVEWDLTQWMSGSTNSAGTRYWSIVDVSIYTGPGGLSVSAASANPVTINGDTISSDRVAYSYDGSVEDPVPPGLGYRDTVLSAHYTGTHDFAPFDVSGGYTTLRILHSANIDVKNGGNCTQNYYGTIQQFFCPWPWDPDGASPYCASLLPGV